MKPAPNHSAILTICLLFLLSAGAFAQLQEEQRSQLLERAEALRQEWRQQRAEAEVLARQNGLPVRQEFSSGAVIELQRFEGSHPIYYITDNDKAAKTTSTDKVWPGGTANLALTGEGIVIGIWDGGGVRLSHQEFTGRATQADNPSGLHWHASHVAGTMMANGVVERARGMANQASLLAHDWNSDDGEMTAQAANGLQLSNHSYGTVTGWRSNARGDGRYGWYGDPNMNSPEDYKFGYYDGGARAWDAIAYNAPYYLILKSAGNDRGDGPATQPDVHWELVNSSWQLSNKVRDIDGGKDGYDCISTKGNAKNILTIGAIDDLPNGYASAEEVRLASFTGFGPTDDGRIKPDLVANGLSLYSATSTSNSAYSISSGTSMSTPNTTGSLALLLHHQKNLHGSSLMRSSTLKALAIHTADEAGSAPGPDYRHGWGVLNTENAAKLMTRDAQSSEASIIEESLLDQYGIVEVPVFSSGRGPLRATICWTDPAGTTPPRRVDPANKILVHDLDLRVISPTGAIHYPWRMDPANPSAPASRGDNEIDNVEQVFIPLPEEGTYIVQVTHKDSMRFGEQIVSIVVSVSNEPTLVAPENRLAGVSPTATLQWREVKGIQTYRLQVAETTDFKSPVVDRGDLTDPYFTPSLERNKRYFWRMNYSDQNGTSEWSDIWSFFTGGIPTDAGYAVYLDGDNDYISIPHTADLDALENAGSFTIETWVYPIELSGDAFPVFNKYNAGNDSGWSLQFTKSLIQYLDETNRSIPASIDLNEWHHVAMRFDGSKERIAFFVDGNQMGERSLSDGPVPTGDGTLYVGWNRSNNDQFAHGYFDEIRVWGTARTEAEIDEWHLKRADAGDPNLLAVFRLDDGRGFVPVNELRPANFDSLKNGATWVVSEVPLDLPPVPVLLSPVDAINVPLLPEYVWYPSTSADEYRIQIATDEQFGDIIQDENNIPITSIAGEKLAAETDYYWRVRAKNARGTSEWSETGHFRTAVAPPPPPVLLAPADGTVNAELEGQLVWNGAPRAQSYTIQASADSTFDPNEQGLVLDVDRHTTSGIPITNLGFNTTYYWRVAGRNLGGRGEWSDVWEFTTKPALPERPRLTSPQNNAVGIDTDVRLEWLRDEGTENYWLQVDTDPAFQSTLLDRQGIPSNTYAVNGLNEATMHYWRVRGVNSAGISGWSETWSFMTTRPVPEAPMLSAPADGATDVLRNTMLEWLPAEYAAEYRLQVAKADDFSAPVIDTKFAGESFPVSPLLEATTTYYWRVNAENESGSSPWSAVWSFTTGTQPDKIVELISPENRATDVPQDADFLWHSVEGAKEYRFQLAEDNLFTAPMDDQTLSDTSYAVTGLEVGETYYWRVRSDDDDWSAIWSFTVVLPLPGEITPLWPTANLALLDPEVEFKWTAGSPKVNRYWLQHTAEFGDDSLALYASPVSDSTITDTTFTRSLYSLGNRTWWRVRAGNASGWGPWSEVMVFTPIIVDVDDPPGVPVSSFLSPAYPMPVTGIATATIGLAERGYVSISIHDLLGRKLMDVRQGMMQAGYHSVSIHTGDLPPGRYIMVLQTEGRAHSQPIIIGR